MAYGAGIAPSLARAITLVESDLAADGDLAARLLDSILPFHGRRAARGHHGRARRGQSTFIDALGMHLIRERGEAVAVLSVDPSSPISGGSILGDKTRMERLSVEERAFIRPSPSRGHTGGVTRRTRETVLLCEAAGYGNILVETVGVGQSETAVRSMTDFFLLLGLAGAGDELQGIKRGILEMIDAMAIKQGGWREQTAGGAGALRVCQRAASLPRPVDGWTPRVVTCSALHGDGIAEIWDMILDHRRAMEASGWIARRRSAQAVEWMSELVTLGLGDALRPQSAGGGAPSRIARCRGPRRDDAFCSEPRGAAAVRVRGVRAFSAITFTRLRKYLTPLRLLC